MIGHDEREHGPIAVRSILKQTGLAAFEVVFVDDGSRDGTPEVVAAAAQGDPRFRLVRLPVNVGRGAARSAGVREARSSIIGFVDADITLPNDWLQRCLESLKGHAAVSGIPVPDGDVAVVARLSGARPRIHAGSMPITGSNVLFQREVLENVGFDPRDRLGEDFRHANRLLKAGYSLHRVPGLAVRHHDRRTYREALAWRFENGVDAASHPRELGRLRLSDAVWLGWLVAWAAALAGVTFLSPWWLLAGPTATLAAAVAHITTRFESRPVRPFLFACLIDVPLMAAYLVGRTVGIPRLLRGR